jgi:hypothetical protein
MAKKKYEKITSPIGIANYPYLNTPDTKFKDEGEYKVDLLLDKVEDAQFLGNLKARSEKAFEEAKVKLAEQNKHAQAKELRVYYPFEVIYDEEGNPTDKVKVKFKSKAQFTTKDGKVITITPNLFDAQGKEINRDEVIVYGGSKLRVNFTPNAFYSPAIDKAGISLRINAAQVIELGEGNYASAENFGFGVVDDGFSVEDSDFGSPEAASEDNTSSGEGGDFNFQGADF